MSENTKKQWSRREALGLLTVAGAAWSTACGGDSPTSPSTITSTSTNTTPTPTTATPPTSTTPPTNTASCVVSPTETIGPFPSLSDFVRSDIREGKSGLPLTLTISVVNTNSSCSAVSGALVDIWQCDASGNYSQYGSERNLTYLRGLQTTDSTGRVVFTTIYPGWYQGRATHIHVEVTINGLGERAGQLLQEEAVGGQAEAGGALDLGQVAHQVGEAGPQRRLAAGQA